MKTRFHVPPPAEDESWGAAVSLPANGALTIGFGDGVCPPRTYALRQTQEVDVGFLRVYLSTKQMDYSHVTQLSPFPRSFRRGTSTIERPGPVIEQQENWGAITIPIVQTVERTSMPELTLILWWMLDALLLKVLCTIIDSNCDSSHNHVSFVHQNDGSPPDNLFGMSTRSSPEYLCSIKPEDDLDSVLRTDLDCFDDGYEDLVYRRRRWWDSPRLREWFLKRNYRLYENRTYASEFPSAIVNPSNFVEIPSEFPFAYHDPPTRAATQPRFSAYTGERGNVGYAQDAFGRHVAIKTILSDSKEREVLEYLLKECFPESIDQFRNILPVLDILAYEGH
ncbi:hypothetical protein H0H93_011505, partial [Arthromyces matolae]